MAKKRIDIELRQKGATKATQETKSLASGIGKAVAAYAAMAVAVNKVGGFLKDSIRLYGIQEQAEKKLATALGHTSKALLGYASALQRQTTFGDEAILGVQASIAAFIKDEDQIKKATKATLDMAVALGMDLKGAGDLVAKTLGSTTNALTRYGVTVTGAVGSSERLYSVTDGIAKLWGGQAIAAADTMTGRLEQMSNAWGDVKEQIGDSLVTYFNLTERMKTLAIILQGETEKVRTLSNVTAEHEFNIRNLTFQYSQLEDKESIQAKAMLRQIEHEQKILGALQEKNKETAKQVTMLSDWQVGYNNYVQTIEREAAATKLALEYKIAYNMEQGKAIKPGQSDPIAPQVDSAEKLLAVTGKLSNYGSDITSMYGQQIAAMDNLQSGANTLFSILSSGSDKQRKETKDWALLAAYVNTAAGITKAFAQYGWPKGIIPAAAIAAAGATQIGAIQARETGGPVEAGMPYKVGEKGEELLVPAQSGYIIPNGAFGGMTLNFNGNITDRKYVQNYLIPEIKKAVQLGRA